MSPLTIENMPTIEVNSTALNGTSPFHCADSSTCTFTNINFTLSNQTESVPPKAFINNSHYTNLLFFNVRFEGSDSSDVFTNTLGGSRTRHYNSIYDRVTGKSSAFHCPKAQCDNQSGYCSPKDPECPATLKQQGDTSTLSCPHSSSQPTLATISSIVTSFLNISTPATANTAALETIPVVSPMLAKTLGACAVGLAGYMCIDGFFYYMGYRKWTAIHQVSKLFNYIACGFPVPYSEPKTLRKKRKSLR